MRISVVALALVVGCSSSNPNQQNGSTDMAGQQQQQHGDMAMPNNNQNDGSMNQQADMTAPLSCSGCPHGYSCDSNGQCTGGDPNSLVLDVKTLKVSGTVTINSQVPALTAACTNSTVEAVVHLVDAGRGHNFDIPILCSSTSAAFDAVVFPGDYKVTVTGDETLSELPKAAYSLPDLSLTSDRTGLAFDVKMVQVDGTVTLNGAPPMLADCDTNTVAVEVEPMMSTGSYFTLQATCGSPVNFSGKVYPGTYSVTILGVGDVTAASNLAFAVSAPLNANNDQHGVQLDVKTFNIGGPLKIDNASPNATDCTGAAGSTVYFFENNSGAQISTSAACTTNVLNIPTLRVFAGQYTVDVYGNGGSPLSSQQYPIADKYTVSGDQTNDTFNIATAAAALLNVGGTVTLNNSAPVENSNCFTSQGSVVFVDSAKQTTKGTFDIACGGAATFTGSLPAGTYDIFVYDQYDGSNLLAPGFPALKNFNLSGNKTDFAFNEKTVAVSGKVTLNGMDPATVGTCDTGSSQYEGTVHLSQMSGPSFDLRIPCSAGAFAWSGQVYPGSYTVSVDGASGSSSLPDEAYKLASSVDTTAGASNVNLDVLTTNVAGKLTLNGVAPSTTTQCNANPNQQKATVTLFNIDQSASFTLPVLCSSTDFSWNGVVFPGSYRITVSGAGGYSSLPKNSYLAAAKLMIP